MVKKKLTLTVEEKVIKEAKKYGINLSSFLEIRLQEYLALIRREIKNSSSSFPHQKNHHGIVMGPPEFESESLAPKARRIDQATPRALGC